MCNCKVHGFYAFAFYMDYNFPISKNPRGEDSETLKSTMSHVVHLGVSLAIRTRSLMRGIKAAVRKNRIPVAALNTITGLPLI